MNTKNILITLLTAAVIILLLMQRCGSRFHNKNSTPPTTADSTQTIRYITRPGDTVIRYREVQVPAIFKIPYSIYDTAYVDAPVDTALILQDYLARYAYRDTLQNDTSALIVVFDTLSRNRIQKRGYAFQNRRPVQVVQVERHINPAAKVPTFQLMVGIQLQGSAHSFGLAPQLAAQYKGRQYGIGYDVINKNVQLGFWLPLGRRQ